MVESFVLTHILYKPILWPQDTVDSIGLNLKKTRKISFLLFVELKQLNAYFSFQNKVVSNVLYHRGILPGYSKWSRNPSPLEAPYK